MGLESIKSGSMIEPKCFMRKYGNQLERIENRTG